jgi:hypothetical protein
VGQDEERPPGDWCELHDHTVIALRVFVDEQAENEPVRSMDLQAFARVLDILTAPVTHDLNSPPTRASISTRIAFPIRSANRNDRASSASSHASKMRSGAALT